MGIKHIAKWVALVSFLNWNQGFAGPSSYQCVITERHWVDDNGRLEKRPHKESKRLSVSRVSGTIIGTAKYFHYPIQDGTAHIIDEGGAGTSFIVTYASETQHLFSVLHIKEWASGATKPFLLMDGLGVSSGTCE